MRRSSILLVLAGLVFAGLAVLPVQIAQSAVECRTTYFLGARGSGQTMSDSGGYGGEVRQAHDLLLSKLSPGSVLAEPLSDRAYPAYGVELLRPTVAEGVGLASGKPPIVAAALASWGLHAKRYFDGLSAGVDAAVSKLQTRARTCADERLVLSGYSQGAMVMHRVLLRLAAAGRSDILARVDGVILFADGDRNSDMQAKLYGAETAPRDGEGVGQYLVAHQEPIPASVRPFVYQRCARGDLVCDFHGVTSVVHAGEGVALHGTYAVPEGVNSIAAAVAHTIENPGDRQQGYRVFRDPGGTAYLVDPAGSRRWIPDGMTFACHTNNRTPVLEASLAEIAARYPDEAGWSYCFDKSTASGRLVTYTGDDSSVMKTGAMYRVDSNGQRHYVSDSATAFCRSADGTPTTSTKWSQYLSRLGSGAADQCFDLNFFKNRVITTSLGGRWLMGGDSIAHPIKSNTVQNCLRGRGFPQDELAVVSYMNRLKIGANATCIDGTTARGKMLRAPEGDVHYIAEDGLRHWVPDDATLLCRQSAGVPMLQVGRADIDAIGEGGWDNCFDLNVFKGRILRNQVNGSAYMVDSSGAARHWIPDELTWRCRTEAQGVTVVNAQRDNYFGAIAESGWDSCFDMSVVKNRIMRNTTNGVSFFVGGDSKRHWVPDSATWDCRIQQGATVVGYQRANYETAVSEGGWDYCYDPAIFRGKVLSHSDGDSHYIHPDDTRTWIPDEFTYNCRMRQGKAVVNTRWRQYVDNHTDKGWDWCFDIETFKNTVIEHPAGDRHFVDARGVRHWIHDDGVRDCLRDTRGLAPRTVRWREYIQAIPEGDWAICGDTIRTGMKLDRGQSLRSSDGRYWLHMQTDGNFVAYNAAGRAIWATNRTGSYVVVQGDGNLVEYGPNGAVWSTSTVGTGANRLVMQSDGNIVLYNSSNRAVWASNTVGR